KVLRKRDAQNRPDEISFESVQVRTFGNPPNLFYFDTILWLQMKNLPKNLQFFHRTDYFPLFLQLRYLLLLSAIQKNEHLRFFLLIPRQTEGVPVVPCKPSSHFPNLLQVL